MGWLFGGRTLRDHDRLTCPIHDQEEKRRQWRESQDLAYEKQFLRSMHNLTCSGLLTSELSSPSWGFPSPCIQTFSYGLVTLLLKVMCFWCLVSHVSLFSFHPGFLSYFMAIFHKTRYIVNNLFTHLLIYPSISIYPFFHPSIYLFNKQSRNNYQLPTTMY